MFLIKNKYKGDNSVTKRKGDSPLKGSDPGCTCANADLFIYLFIHSFSHSFICCCFCCLFVFCFFIKKKKNPTYCIAQNSFDSSLFLFFLMLKKILISSSSLFHWLVIYDHHKTATWDNVNLTRANRHGS